MLEFAPVGGCGVGAWRRRGLGSGGWEGTWRSVLGGGSLGEQCFGVVRMSARVVREMEDEASYGGGARTPLWAV